MTNNLKFFEALQELYPYSNEVGEKLERKYFQSPYYSRPIHGTLIEVWDITQAWDLGRNEAQALQYILRAKWKDQEKDDLKKAIHFLERALEEMESST